MRAALSHDATRAAMAGMAARRCRRGYFLSNFSDAELMQ